MRACTQSQGLATIPRLSSSARSETAVDSLSTCYQTGDIFFLQHSENFKLNSFLILFFSRLTAHPLEDELKINFLEKDSRKWETEQTRTSISSYLQIFL